MIEHKQKRPARVAELADATDLKSVGFNTRAGSSPATSTKKATRFVHTIYTAEWSSW